MEISDLLMAVLGENVMETATSFAPRLFAIAFTTVLLLVVPPALPAETEETVISAVIEEIVVTARKRAESMQDTPVTVTAFSKQTLDMYNLDSLESVADLTPGLVISDSSSGSGGTIAMRGMSTGTGNTSFDQTVSIVFDGIALNHSYVLRVSQLDMQQVEVLKGPQALFFGKNSPGGVMYFQTADPGDEFEASIRVGHEFEADELVISAVISGPISDTLGGRLVLYRSDMDGWVTNIATPTAQTDPSTSKYPEQEEFFVRGTLVFEPSDVLKMRTKVSNNQVDGNLASANVMLVACPGGVEPAGTPCGINDQGVRQLLDPPFVDGVEEITGRSTLQDTDWILASHEINYELLDGLTFTSLTGYSEHENYLVGDAISGNGSGLLSIADITKESFSQEFRFTSNNDGPLNYSAGAFYSKGQVTSRQLPFIHGPLLGLPTGLLIPLAVPDPIYTVNIDSISIFGELSWDISDELVLSVGARWTDEDRDFSISENGIDVSDRAVTDADGTNTSPEVTLTWKPNDDATYFISYREGFKSSGHNSVFRGGGGYSAVPVGTQVDQSYKQETVEGVEAGFKLNLLDNRMRFNGSVFSYDYTDMQLSTFDQIALVQRVLNAGESTVQGAELDMQYLLESVEGLSLSLGIAYTDATFDSFIGPCYGGQTEAEGCMTLPGGGTGQDHAGRELLYAPELAVSVGLNYSTKISGDWSLNSGLTAYHSDAYLFDAFYAPASDVQDSYTKVNANLTFGYQDNWEFSLIGNNLTNEYTVGGGGAAPLLPNGHVVAVVSRGRQITLQAEWSY